MYMYYIDRTKISKNALKYILITSEEAKQLYLAFIWQAIAAPTHTLEATNNSINERK